MMFHEHLPKLAHRLSSVTIQYAQLHPRTHIHTCVLGSSVRTRPLRPFTEHAEHLGGLELGGLYLLHFDLDEPL